MNINFSKTSGWAGSRSVGSAHIIVDADSPSKRFSVDTDVTASILAGGSFTVGDDVYTVVSRNYNSPNTDIVVNEAIISEIGTIEYISSYNYNTILASIETYLDSIYTSETAGLTIDDLIAFDVYAMFGAYSGICNYREGGEHQQHRYSGTWVLTTAEKDDITANQTLISMNA